MTWSARIVSGVFLAVGVELAAVLVDVVAPRGVAWTVAGLLGIAGVTRFLQLGLYLDDEGVRVVNVTHTVTVPWEAVRGFRWDDGAGAMAGVPGWPARLVTSGRRHRITATWAFYPGEKERVLDALRPFTTPRSVPVEPGRVGGNQPPPSRDR